VIVTTSGLGASSVISIACAKVSFDGYVGIYKLLDPSFKRAPFSTHPGMGVATYWGGHKLGAET